MSDFWSKMREKRVEQLEKHQFGIPTQVKHVKKGLKTGVLRGSKMGDSGISSQIWAERVSKRGYFWGC